MPGFVELWREYLDHEVFQDENLWRLFSWCLMSANYLPSTYRGVALEPGQFVMGRITDSQRLKIPEATFDRRMKKLEKLGLISRKANSQFTVITLIDKRPFEDYRKQVDTAVDTTSDTAVDTTVDATNGQPVIQPVDTNKEGNKGTREQEIPLRPSPGGEAKPKPKRPDPEPDDSPVVLEFPVSGKPFRWNLTQRQVDEWERAYPQLDILDQCRKSLVWLKANHLKTARGMERFLVNWFSRSISSGRVNGHSSNQDDPRGNFAARQEFLRVHGIGDEQSDSQSEG